MTAATNVNPGGTDARDAGEVRRLADDLARVARYAADPARKRRLEMAARHAEEAAAWLAGERDDDTTGATR